MIISVLIHKKRLKERGYNQVEGFGKALSRAFNIPYNDQLLHRKIHNKTQTKKNLLGRTELSSNVFTVSFSENHHGNHFLLIDDVITTGATLETCYRALREIPNAKISIVCMAMAHS